jgi:hypothetical protein
MGLQAQASYASPTTTSKVDGGMHRAALGCKHRPPMPLLLRRARWMGACVGRRAAQDVARHGSGEEDGREAWRSVVAKRRYGLVALRQYFF